MVLTSLFLVTAAPLMQLSSDDFDYETDFQIPQLNR